jgi:hypothetical protein
MNFLKKIQQQPEYVRKLILWAITIIIGLGLIIFWFWSSYRGMRGFSKERFIQNLNFPSLKSETKNIPGAEVLPSLEKKLKAGKEK